MADTKHSRPDTVITKMDIRRLDPDKLLLDWGWTGVYQLFVALCCSSVWVFLALQSMSWAFIGLHHPYTCVHHHQQNETLSYDMRCFSPVDNDTKCGAPDSNTSFAFDPSFGSTLTSEYVLVCDRYVLAQLGTTLFTAGGLVANIPVAQMSDAFGRKPTFIGCYMTSIMLTIMRVYFHSYMIDMVLYVILGATSAGVVSTGYVMACEMLTPNMRGVALSMMEGEIWVLGYILQGFAVMVWPNWRDMVFWTNAPFLLSITFIWLIPESLHWLLAEHKYAEAEQWVKTMSKRNCKNYDKVVKFCVQQQIEDATMGITEIRTDSPGPKRSIWDIIKSPVLMFHGAITAFSGMTAMLVYWGLSLFSTQMADDRFTGYFLSGLIEIPAGILGPLLLLKIGRKTLVIIAQVVTIIGFIGRFFCPADAPSWLTLSTFLIAKWGNILIWPGNFLLQAEIFPTTVRNLGYGIMASMSTIGNMTAPFIGNLLITSPAVGCALYVAMCSISAVMTLALPETSGKELPMDIEDANENLGPFLTWYYGRKSLVRNKNRSLNMETEDLTAQDLLPRNEQR